VVKIGKKVTKQAYENKKKQNHTEQEKEVITHHLYGHSFQAKRLKYMTTMQKERNKKTHRTNTQKI
jgi:hypothetical protein